MNFSPEASRILWYAGAVIGSWTVLKMIWLVLVMATTKQQLVFDQKRSQFISEISLWFIAVLLLLIASQMRLLPTTTAEPTPWFPDEQADALSLSPHP